MPGLLAAFICIIMSLMCMFKPDVMWKIDPRTGDAESTEEVLKKIKREGYVALIISLYMLYIVISDLL
jgi:Ca2+/Na+ antiporter